MIHRILFLLSLLLVAAYIIIEVAPSHLKPALWHILGLLLCAAIGIENFLSFKKSRRKVYYVSNTPTSKIGSAVQGYVELKGKLILPEGQAPLLSPLSHTACLWWKYDISEYKYRRGWVSIDSVQSNTAFYMEDETGQCCIHPQNAVITAHTQKRWKGDQRHPQQKKTWWEEFIGSLSSYRYTEHFLLPDQPFYALGYFQYKDGKALLEKPSDGKPFILSTQEEKQVIYANRINACAALVMLFIAAIVAIGIIWHGLR